MKYTVLCLLLLTASTYAEDIASCSNPSGKGYYPQTGIVSAKDAGWTDEKITGGITKVSKLANGKYDILFVDARKEIFSAQQSGGHVMMLNRGKNAFSILVIYLGKTAEIYTFIKTGSGKLEYIQTLSRAGDEVLITKASIMRGDCEYIDFESL